MQQAPPPPPSARWPLPGRPLPPSGLGEAVLEPDQVVVKCHRLDPALASSAVERISHQEAFLEGLASLPFARGARPLFTRPPAVLVEELQALEPPFFAATRQHLPDLTTWARLQLHPDVSPPEVCQQLAKHPGVDLAYRAFATEPQPSIGPVDLPPVTQDFRALQGYLDAPPDGLGVRSIGRFTARLAAGIRLGVVERGLNPDHEAFGAAMSAHPLQTLGVLPKHRRDDGHANATLGLLLAPQADFGIEGMTPAAELVLSYPYRAGSAPDSSLLSVAAAVDELAAELRPGDVLLVELQTAGMPVEEDQAVFDALVLACVKGVSVVLPTGNWSYDLDAQGCGGRYDRSQRDSGAVFVCGCTSPLRTPPPRRFFVGCHGGRVDACAWADASVVTAANSEHNLGAPADLFAPELVPPYLNAYTESYRSTSAASAQATGVLALAADVGRRLCGSAIEPMLLRGMLSASGTPPDPGETRAIGCQPNLPALLDAIRDHACAGLTGSVASTPPLPLTTSLGDALEGLALGLTYAEVASSLGISLSAMGSRVYRLYQRLGVHSRLEAIRAARHWGLV